MRIKFHRIEKKREEAVFKANDKIEAEEVFVIDENGEALGVMSIDEALAKAEEADLDLVEVNPRANPPVVKIANLGQLKYEHEKLKHKQRMHQKKVELKNIRLTFRISAHDLELRMNQAKKFLAKENKTKIEMILRGRERQHTSRATEIVKSFVARLQEDEELNVEIEQPLTIQGGRLTIVLVNKK
ncbi:MAG: translation initiation factor IF-3 [Patescibacteria group bacterium]|jgi:translation initiation factor IF-3